MTRPYADPHHWQIQQLSTDTAINVLTLASVSCIHQTASCKKGFMTLLMGCQPEDTSGMRRIAD